MGEIVSLRNRRKARARADRTEKAAENRVRFGRSRTERGVLKTAELKRARELDGRRLESREES